MFVSAASIVPHPRPQRRVRRMTLYLVEPVPFVLTRLQSNFQHEETSQGERQRDQTSSSVLGVVITGPEVLVCMANPDNKRIRRTP